MTDRTKIPEGMEDLHTRLPDGGVMPNAAIVACWEIADRQRAIGANAPLCDMIDDGDMSKRHLRHPKWLALNASELLAMLEGLMSDTEGRNESLGYECPDCAEPVCNHTVLRERDLRAQLAAATIK